MLNRFTFIFPTTWMRVSRQSITWSLTLRDFQAAWRHLQAAAKTGAVARLSVVQLRLEVNLELRFQGKPMSLRLVNPGTGCLRRLASATLTKPSPAVHRSFALVFSHLFSWHTSNPEREPQKGSSHGTVSNRDLLSNGSVLPEVSSSLASRILDWTSGAGPSA